MPARSVLILALLVQWTASSCDPEQLSVCTGCCAMLFSSHECDPADVFRIKVNGNGILGAMWDDVPVAAIVRPGCLLELWDWKNQTGKHRAFGLDGYEVYHFDRYGFENMASSAKCTCIKR